MNSLVLFCPSTGGHEEAVTTWQDTMSKPWPIVVDDATTGDEAGFLSKCDKFWRTTDASVIGYLHNDIYLHEKNWDQRVLRAFDDERVGVVGFVGATRLGDDLIYRVPYDFRQLARGDVWSNLTDAEAHGRRDASIKRIAVVDSCAVFVKRDLLARVGGWPIGRYPNSSHCSDLWICCVARRYNLHVCLGGISCTHRSGGKGAAGTRWMDEHYGSDVAAHRQAHELIYRDFIDVLPIRV